MLSYLIHTFARYISDIKLAMSQPHIGTVKIMSIDRCHHENTDDLHFFPSCSMVVTSNDHVTSLVVFCDLYLSCNCRPQSPTSAR